jgi:hypothetical protein
MRRIAIAAFASLAAAAPAAAQTAPLPPHWALDVEEADEGRDLGPPLRGIYARGVADPRRDQAGDYVRDGGEPICRGDEAEQQAWLERLDAYLTEFWFYGTRSQAVLFRRSVRPARESPCTAAPVYAYAIERGFIADGFFHKLEFGQPGIVASEDSRRIGSREPDYSGGFGPFYSFATRDMDPPAGRAENRRIAGLPARCWVDGFGYMVSEVCVARSGAARGLPLMMNTTTDDGQAHYWTEVREVVADARLDPRLFDLYADWQVSAR